MPDLGELRQRRGADTLGRRIRESEFLVLLLQIGELAKQAVVFRIADFRIVQDVVAPVVVLEFLPQPLGTVPGLLWRAHLRKKGAAPSGCLA